MAEPRQPDWDRLLLRSEELVHQVRCNLAFEIAGNAPSPLLQPDTLRPRPFQEADLPRVERDIMQIEQFSQRLRSKNACADASAEVMDASRLLAQEGLNPRK